MMKRYLERCHGKIGWLGISCLMLPILAWVWLAASGPVISVFGGGVPQFIISGRIFSEPFYIGHAGSAMDQPTIGKWLFWFTAMTVTAFPYVVAVRWVSNRSKKNGRIAFGITVAILCVFLLCILSWPLCWLIQYVCSMGVAPRRIYGLIYSGVGGLLVIGFLYWACRKPKTKVESA